VCAWSRNGSARPRARRRTPPDKGWTTFWPLDRWQAAKTVDDDAPDLILIADYCLSSWWYAVPRRADAGAPVSIVAPGTRVVAPSFSAFVDAVLKDDPSVKV
jgi:hypothetical protein